MVVHFGPTQILALLVGVVLPLLAAVVTRAHASAAVRAVVLLGLSAATSFVASWVSALGSNGVGRSFDVVSAAIIAAGTFGVGVVTSLVGAVTPTVRERGGFIGRRRPRDPPDTPPG